MNLVEAHVLAAIRRDFNVPLWKVRQALDYLGRHIPSRYPLADERFETNGVDLFVRQAGRLVAVCDSGQLAMREMLERYLKRIERDRHGVPIRLYPFTTRPDRGAPRPVVIDPRVSFGRPILRGTGISTAIIAERYKAGESMTDLAKDYGRPRTDIEEAIRCELEVEAA
jgi:uncharacterized protein (DUF433 family)